MALVPALAVKSLMKKLHDIMAGQDVLGSGTASLTGIVQKNKGYFSVLSMYNFAITDPTSIATMQVCPVCISCFVLFWLLLLFQRDNADSNCYFLAGWHLHTS